ncbi:MAG: S9 family peptidase [Pseudomonadota bacterium]
MLFRFLAFAVVLAFQTPWAHTQEPAAERPVLEDFLGQADFWSPELSPSGRYLSGVRRVDEATYLLIMDLDAPDLEPQFLPIGDSFLNWVEWVTDNRLLISITSYINLRTGKTVTVDDWDDLGEKDYPVPVTRIVSMNRDGSDSAVMFGDDVRMNRNFSLGRVVSFLTHDPDHILMTGRRGGDLDLFKLNVWDGSFERIALGTDNTYAWYVDRNGEPAFRFNTNARGTIIFIYAREDRANGKIKWRLTKKIRLKRNRKDETATEFDPLSAGPTETTYYVAARPEGEDKTGIYLYDFEKDEFLETIRTHPEVDVYWAFFNRETRELQGVSYNKDRLVIEYEDKTVQRHLDALNVYFGDALNVIPMMSNRDGTRWLVRAIGPTDPGSFHIYDLERTEAEYIGSNMVDLAGKSLGQTEVIAYQARDGLALRGYLTRPPNADPDAQLPLIMMPHGGPESRDVITFDYRVQVLVAHGYQVFQPNFRGSSGFGKSFADLGRRQWGKAMQTDVDDAFAHLVEAGLADPDRACILGGSYGGYSALVAATLTPDLYQCAVAIAAPSDLVSLLKWERKQEGRNSETYKYVVNHIGDPRKNKAELEAVSPTKLAEYATRPILIIHGENDGVVPIRQAELMDEALKKYGKAVTKIVLEDSSHSYRSDEDERIEYEAILAFLSEHLPVDRARAETVEAMP